MFLSGPSGSGKQSIIREIFQYLSKNSINPDTYRKNMFENLLDIVIFNRQIKNSTGIISYLNSHQQTLKKLNSIPLKCDVCEIESNEMMENQRKPDLKTDDMIPEVPQHSVLSSHSFIIVVINNYYRNYFLFVNQRFHLFFFCLLCYIG